MPRSSGATLVISYARKALAPAIDSGQVVTRSQSGAASAGELIGDLMPAGNGGASLLLQRLVAVSR